MHLSDGALLKMHADALWEHDADGRMLRVNQWDGDTAPRLYLGRTASGAVWRFRHDVPGALAMKLANLCAQETLETEHSELPRFHDEYLRLLGEQAEIENIESGPAFLILEVCGPARQAIAVSDQNRTLLEDGLPDWLPDVPHRQPMMASIDGGRAVSICCSVRITPAAHEAGVETLRNYRGQGLGRATVVAWARVVRSTGALPLYSTSWDNLPSRGLAKSLGMSMYGVRFLRNLAEVFVQ
jgi:GNAT superfamily N-acetyltransferase